MNKEEIKNKRKICYQKNRKEEIKTQKKYHIEHKKERNEYALNYYYKNKEKRKGFVKKYSQENKEKIRNYNKKYRKSYFHIKRKHNLIFDYNTLLMKQNCVCAICFKKETIKHQSGTIRRLSIDHNHKTNKVRGLLCGNCNAGLGFFQDNPTLLRRAIKYLEEEKL